MPSNTLFVGTRNSARSLMAECALARWGSSRFQAFSAGSQPKGAPHPLTLELLRGCHHDVSKLRSKSWDEFAALGARLCTSCSPCAFARGARRAPSGRGSP